jgi:hypothetical protein
VRKEHGEDVHVVALYLYSDETQVAKFGNANAYPLHVTVANFTNKCRGKKGNGRILLAYLPVCHPLKGTRTSSYVKKRLLDVRQEALSLVLQPLIEVMPRNSLFKPSNSHVIPCN